MSKRSEPRDRYERDDDYYDEASDPYEMDDDYYYGYNGSVNSDGFARQKADLSHHKVRGDDGYRNASKGSAGDDLIAGGSRDDVLSGGLGSDIISAGAGKDIDGYNSSVNSDGFARQKADFSLRKVRGDDGYRNDERDDDYYDEARDPYEMDDDYYYGYNGSVDSDGFARQKADLSHHKVRGDDGYRNASEGSAGYDLIAGGSRDDVLNSVTLVGVDPAGLSAANFVVV